jgi:thiamine biosynthesis lipoprotein
MKQTRILMGMPITVEIVDPSVTDDALEKAYAYFDYVDQKFSTYKDTSEIMQINEGKIREKEYSDDMKTIFALSEETKRQTNGFFDIHRPDGTIDPSGLVKGWSIQKVAELLEQAGFEHFYVEAGGDIQVKGKNTEGKQWRVGIRNPFKIEEIVKVVYLEEKGMATSGTYIRGQHIYNPHAKGQLIEDIVSLTVIGPNVYEADRFATAAFAMGKAGIGFIEKLEGLEGYMIDKNGIATMTSGFNRFTI